MHGQTSKLWRSTRAGTSRWPTGWTGRTTPMPMAAASSAAAPSTTRPSACGHRLCKKKNASVVQLSPNRLQVLIDQNGAFFWRSRRDLVQLRRQHVQRLGYSWKRRITVSTGRHSGDTKRETYPRRLLPSTRAKCRNCPDQPGPSPARSPRLTVRPCRCMSASQMIRE